MSFVCGICRTHKLDSFLLRVFVLLNNFLSLVVVLALYGSGRLLKREVRLFYSNNGYYIIITKKKEEERKKNKYLSLRSRFDWLLPNVKRGNH